MVDSEHLKELTEIKGMREKFLRHHSIGMPGIDYDQYVHPDIF
jgi:trans-2-enoyl-CoA reductase